jgi:flagellar hook-associated protein 2
MTREEIERWEEEARRGVLHNDASIRRLLNDLRSELFNMEINAGISLHEMGITTTAFRQNSLDNGTLEINETRLTNAINTNLDAMRNFFVRNVDYESGIQQGRMATDAEKANQGLSQRLDRIIHEAIRQGGYTGHEVSRSNNGLWQGSLIRAAGRDDDPDQFRSATGRNVRRINDQIARLTRQLEAQYNRFWRQFSHLEVALSRMDAQAGWLMQFQQPQ